MNLKENLINVNIVKENHWKLRSERHSNLYINKDDIILNPVIYNIIADMLASKIVFDFNDIEYDGIISPAVAGICFGAPVAMRLGKPFIYPEKKYHLQNTDDYVFVFRSNFQEYIKGKKFIIVEDVVTTALSIMKIINAIEACGGEVILVYCIWNRDPNGIAYIARDGDIKHGSIKFTVGKNVISGGYLIPVRGLIEEKIEDWKKEECPLCEEGVFPLLDPKTMEVVGV